MKKINFASIIFGFLILELIFWLNQINGFILYAILIGAVLIFMERDPYINKRDIFLIFLMIIPIARISELFIPFNSLWRILIFYSIVTFLAVFYANKFSIKFGEINIGNLRYTLGVILIGVLLALGAKFIFNMENPLIIFLILLIAYSEEILFRGEIQNLTREDYGALYSILFTSLLYGIFSISYGFPIFLYAFFASLILCSIYQFTKNIFLSFFVNIIFHALSFIFLFHLLSL